MVPWAGLLGFRGRLGVGFRVPLAEVARPPRQNRSDCVRLFLPKTGQGRKASSPERAAANESILKVAHSKGLRPLPPTPKKKTIEKRKDEKRKDEKRKYEKRKDERRKDETRKDEKIKYEKK